MKAEEVKLERLRQRIEDQDWKLMRGQLSVHEHDLANEIKDIDGDSVDSIHVTEALGMVGNVSARYAVRSCGSGGNMARRLHLNLS